MNAQKFPILWVGSSDNVVKREGPRSNLRRRLAFALLLIVTKSFTYLPSFVSNVMPVVIVCQFPSIGLCLYRWYVFTLVMYSPSFNTKLSVVETEGYPLNPVPISPK